MWLIIHWKFIYKIINVRFVIEQRDGSFRATRKSRQKRQLFDEQKVVVSNRPLDAQPGRQKDAFPEQHATVERRARSRRLRPIQVTRQLFVYIRSIRLIQFRRLDSTKIANTRNAVTGSTRPTSTACAPTAATVSATRLVSFR